MKKFMFLFAFVLFALVSTAGYSDSSVTKNACDLQVSSDVDFDANVDFSDVEKAGFVLNSPDLGSATPGTSFLSVRVLKGYRSGLRAPPDYGMTKNRSLTYKDKSRV